ncbi:MAG: panC [Evtepia sp.]|jgi:pantoate--beta-alanine ligase|nr:panC [Evtepia sp.]
MIKICKTISSVRNQVMEWKRQGLTVGLVPTMGFLHEGHQSLIIRAAAENDRVVVSDFVNPTQFAPNEDFASYPRDLKHDATLCEAAGAHLIFHPEVEEMYDQDRTTAVHMTQLNNELCGKSRPIHFDGVCTVVSKLFNIVQPHRGYFGEKDAQQLMIIRRMVRDLNFPIEVVGCPIIREEDGLAKSSRNTYLSAEERVAARVLHRALTYGEELVRNGERRVPVITNSIRTILEEEPLASIDYVELVDANSLQKMDCITGAALCAIAVIIGKTRLIDNFFIAPEELQ